MGAVKTTKTGPINPAEHMGLVVLTARKYYARTQVAPVEDLVQEGAIGLMKAAQKFDPTRGVAFSTWAVWWISAEIQRHLRDRTRVIRLPARKHERGVKEGTLPRDAESLDKIVSGGDCTLLDLIADESIPRADEVLERKEHLAEIRRRANSLNMTPRERQVLWLYFDEDLTLAQIGERLGGLSRERVRQILAEILKALRPRLECFQ